MDSAFGLEHASLFCHSLFHLNVPSSLLNSHLLETSSPIIPLSVFPGGSAIPQLMLLLGIIHVPPALTASSVAL